MNNRIYPDSENSIHPKTEEELLLQSLPDESFPELIEEELILENLESKDFTENIVLPVMSIPIVKPIKKKKSIKDKVKNFFWIK